MSALILHRQDRHYDAPAVEERVMTPTKLRRANQPQLMIGLGPPFRSIDLTS